MPPTLVYPKFRPFSWKISDNSCSMCKVHRATDKTMSHLFCFGYGYTASFLATKLISLGWKISGTSRDIRKIHRSVRLFDDSEAAMPDQIFEDVTHILISIPPEGDNVLHRYKDCLSHAEWVGYLSATSVYGEHYGNWVTEESRTLPIDKKGIERLNAEKIWRSSALPIHIFRLAAIYGPKRNVLLDLQTGRVRNAAKPDQIFSRIHVEDIVNILLASIDQPCPGSVYNCADDRPSPHTEVLSYAAKLLHIPSIEDLASFSDVVQITCKGSKRVSNAKIKEIFKLSLTYPSYVEGLDNLLDTHSIDK